MTTEWRVLLDESVPRALGFKLAPHFVRTAQTAGFAGLFASLPVAVIVLVAKNNRIETALDFAQLLLNAFEKLEAGQLVRLEL
jgi:hypothetical protein